MPRCDFMRSLWYVAAIVGVTTLFMYSHLRESDMKVIQKWTDVWRTIAASKITQSTSLAHNAARRNSTFSFSEDFSLPHPSAYISIRGIQSWPWVKALREFLISISPARTVTLTAASKDFKRNVLNWLISAQVIADPPIQNILVISFDHSLHNFLTRRGISSLYVPYRSVLSKTKVHVQKVWMTRMAVIRVINHWGFDVRHFDSDAIILRNPESLFQQFPDSDVVGTRAMLPFEIGLKIWGFTVCMGVVEFRSTPRTEFLWKTISKQLKMNKKKTMDDQYRLNYALLELNTTWSTTGELKLLPDVHVTGIDRNGLKVVILPSIYICRALCKALAGSDFYVWHAAGGNHAATTKIQKDTASNLWFLKKDWNSFSQLKGREWLASLMETPTKDLMETPTEDLMETPTEGLMETPTEGLMATPTEGNETVASIISSHPQAS